MNKWMQARLEQINAVRVGAGVAVLGLSGSVFAALPTEAITAMTTVQTDGESMIAAGWPVLAGIVGGLVLMKIFKKVIGRAT